MPRFYLKYFSDSEHQKTIGVWNIHEKKYVRYAPIKSQAYEDYFYDSEGKVEEVLCAFENVSAITFNKMRSDCLLPKRLSEQHLILLTFILLLSERTRYASDTLNENFDKLNKAIFKEHSQFKKHLSKIKFEIANAPIIALSYISQIIPLGMDLHYKILKNKTDIPFITSDNPVAKQNQYMEKRNWPAGHVGIACIGLQILLPIDPSIYLILFDKDIYKVGRNREQIIEVDKKDVKELNKLQYLNARETIYFNENITEQYLRGIDEEVSKKRRKHRMNVQQYIPVKPKKNEKESIITSYAENVQINFSLSFVEETIYAIKSTLGPSMFNVRDPELAETFLKR